MSFDSILNTLVPFVVIIFFLFLVRKPIKGFYDWIKGFFHSKKEDIQEELGIGSGTLIYE